jgi:hypothetical protein
MEILFSIASLVIGVLGTYYAYLQVKAARVAAAVPRPESGHVVSAAVAAPRASKEDLEVVELRDLLCRGLSYEQIIMRLIEMDYDNLEGITETDVGRCETWLPIVRNNPDGMRFVCNKDGVIIGYWHFLPLDDEAYDAMKSGVFDDGDIRLSHLNVIGPPGDYNLYFTIICIVPEYRGVRVMRMLLDAFSDTLLDLAQRGIFFPEICAVAFSEEGRVLCKTLHMTRISTHAERDPVFMLDIKALPASLMYRSELLESYQAHYCPPSVNPM